MIEIPKELKPMMRSIARRQLANPDADPPPAWVLEQLGLTEEDAMTEEQVVVFEKTVSAGLHFEPGEY